LPETINGGKQNESTNNGKVYITQEKREKLNTGAVGRKAWSL
jgi:hypothetical protein